MHVTHVLFLVFARTARHRATHFVRNSYEIVLCAARGKLVGRDEIKDTIFMRTCQC